MSRIKAFIFDQDGVIIDTERDGHRVAFNRTFAEFGFDVEWGVDEYHQLLQVGGGKERMTHYLKTKGFGAEIRPEDQQDLIRRLHKRKTDIFVELIESGALGRMVIAHSCPSPESPSLGAQTTEKSSSTVSAPGSSAVSASSRAAP